MRGAQREAMSLFVSGVCLIAFVLGFQPLTTALVFPIGSMGLFAVAVGTLLFLFATLRRTGNLAAGILELGIVGVMSFGMIFGTGWYFISYLPNSGQPLFNFNMAITPQPTLTPNATITTMPTKTPTPTSIITPSRTPTITSRPTPTATRKR